MENVDWVPDLSAKAHKHKWNLTPKQAVQIQEELRSRVVMEPIEPHNIRLIAGVDVGLPRGAKNARAAVAVLNYQSMEVVEHVTAELPVAFPYIPGLLSFREMPVILKAMQMLATQPDIFMVDGHGYAHPRRFGLACHLGVWLNQATIGCGKSILIGKQTPLGNQRGDVAYLEDAGEIIGAAVRTRDKVKPVYISVGHQTDLSSAIQITLDCGRGVRLPEPIRWAHRLASS